MSSNCGKKRRALVAEDDGCLRLLIEELLTRAGFGVTSVEDGKRALEELDKESFDILITDVQMPRMSGWELLKSLDVSKTPSKVIVMSGNPFLLQGGCMEKPVVMLHKPFNNSEFLDMVCN